MNEHEGVSISTLAKLARTTERTLRFYEEKGLVIPLSRSIGGHRRYSVGQLACINLVHICQEMGMSLDEIKELAVKRTPEIVDIELTKGIERIDEIVNKWRRSQKLLTVLQGTFRATQGIDKESIIVKRLPAKPIILGEFNDYTKDDDYGALLNFYISMAEKYPGIDLNYPVWGAFSEESVRQGKIKWPDRYYFHNPDGLDQIPAALYAIGYGYGGYGDIENLFRRMLKYITSNGYAVCGPSYGEYPINEIFIKNPSGYLMRLLISVQKQT